MSLSIISITSGIIGYVCMGSHLTLYDSEIEVIPLVLHQLSVRLSTSDTAVILSDLSSDLQALARNQDQAPES
ncbi:hypothetical protein TNCV_2725661 [Trichonephila clavipes]|nr:hypothetical protein TNCV_2725661 [Trichonephila clavipes]